MSSEKNTYLYLVILPLLFCLIFIGYKTYNMLQDGKPKVDVINFKIAHNIIQSNVFSSDVTETQQSKPQPDMSSPPLYPVFLAGLGFVHDGLAQTYACYANKGNSCTQTKGLMFLMVVQVMITAVAAWIAFYLAWRLSGAHSTAWATLVVIVLAGRFDQVAANVQPHLFQYLTLFLTGLGLLLYYQTRAVQYLVLAGVALGCAILVHPIYAPLVALLPIIAFFLQTKTKLSAPSKPALINRLWAPSLLFFVAVITLAPWFVRNIIVLEAFALSPDYTAQMLSERIAYNAMTASQWGIQVLSAVPAIGDTLAQSIFSTAQIMTYEKLLQSISVIRPNENVSVFFSQYVLGDTIAYAFSSTALLISSALGGGSVLAFFGLFFIIPLLRVAGRRGELAPLMLVFVPLLGAWLLNSLFTPATLSLNLSVIFIHVYALCYMKGGI